jgi:hypothetical protein
MRRAMIPLLALALLAACLPERERGLPPVGEDLVAAEGARCAKDGGEWGRAPSGGFVCYQRTRDANRGCLRETDCEGLCLARSRSCAPVTPFFGCHEILTALGTRATICTD